MEGESIWVLTVTPPYASKSMNGGPSVSLNSPQNAHATNNASVTFNCSASSSNNLTNITIYSNFSGSWASNSTTNISGTSNSSAFARTLSDGSYIWNCLAYDDTGNSSFAASNYTLTVDTIAPQITIASPANATYATNPQLNFSYSESNPSVCKYSLNNAANQTLASCSINGTTMTSSYGSNNVILYINDTAGNLNSTQKYWTYDNQGPLYAGNLTSPASPQAYSPALSVQFNITAADLYSSVDTVLLEFNGTNYTTTNATSNYTKTLSGIAAGTYNYRWHMNDTLGNRNSTTQLQYVVNKAATVLTLLLNGTDSDQTYYTPASVNATYIADNNEVTVSMYMNGTALVLSGNRNLSNYASAGSWNYTINTTGSQNYSSASASHLVTISQTPAPNITAWSNNRTNDNSLSVAINESQSVLFNLTADQAVDYAWKKNGTSVGSNQPNYTYSNAAIGTWNITAIVNNTNGTSTKTWTLAVADITKPVLAIILPSNTTYNSVSRTLNYTASDNNALGACWYNYNGANTTLAGCINATFTALNNQQSTLTLYANDSAGNVNSTNVTFTVDTTYPQIAFTGTDANDSYKSRTWIYANLTINETNFKNVTFNLYNTTLVNSTNYTDSTRSVNWTGLAEGVYYINATAYDNVGNVNYTETRRITLDTTLPTLSLDSPSNNSWSAANAISFRYVPVDTNLNSCSLYHNATSWAANATNTSVVSGAQSAFSVAMPDGNYAWNVNCSDLAGNSAFNASNFTVHVDATLPTVSFGSATAQNNSYFNRNWIYANATVVEANEANITFTLYNTTLVNSTNSTGGLLGINWTNLASNIRYYYNITVYDNAGNAQSTETRRLTLDSTAPSANITSPLNNTNTTDPTPLVRFNLTDNLAEVINYTVYVNGTANGQTGQGLNLGNFTLNDLALGNYRIKLSALDEASNTANSSEVFVTILPPAVYLASPIDNYFTANTAINFTFNVSDPEYGGLNCSLYINSVYNRSNTSTVNYTNTVFAITGLSEGNNQEWLVRCINPADNTGNNTKTFNVDLTTPAISYGLNTMADNAFTNGDIFVNVSAYDLNEANITFRLYNSTALLNQTTYTNSARSIAWAVSDGTYYYNATIADIVGHSNTTQARTIIVDTQAPVWSGNVSSNSSGVYLFNITWNDNYMNTVLIEHNFTGTLANYSVSNASNAYYYNYSVGGSTYQYRWYANDSAGNANQSDLWVMALSDIAAPLITIVTPANGTALAAGTTSVNVNITTNENATCRHSANSSFSYADGTNFTVTGNMSHSFAYSVASGNTYGLYYLCNDTSGNVNSAATHHTFSISSAATATTTSSSGGGGGGGGGSTTTKTITMMPNEPLTKVVVSLKQSLDSPSITVANAESITAPSPTEPVYRYVSITMNRFNNSQIENATIDFKVNKSWISKNNFTRIWLAHYDSGWNKLRTDLVNSTATVNYYRAYTDAFSYFAIVGEKASAAQAAPPVAEPPKEVVNETPAEQPKEPAPVVEETKAIPYISYAIAAVLLLIMAYAAMKIKAGKKNDEPKEYVEPEPKQTYVQPQNAQELENSGNYDSQAYSASPKNPNRAHADTSGNLPVQNVPEPINAQKKPNAEEELDDIERRLAEIRRKLKE